MAGKKLRPINHPLQEAGKQSAKQKQLTHQMNFAAAVEFTTKTGKQAEADKLKKLEEQKKKHAEMLAKIEEERAQYRLNLKEKALGVEFKGKPFDRFRRKITKAVLKQTPAWQIQGNPTLLKKAKRWGIGV